MEVYTCQTPECGATFTRPPTRGQRPKWCPACRMPGRGGRLRAPSRCCVCGVAVMKRATVVRPDNVCSDACKAVRRFGYRFPLREDWEAEQRRGFVAGWCAWCGAPFTVYGLGSSDRCCSADCTRQRDNRLHYERRRAKEKAAYVENVDHRAVFETDGWRCYLCGELTDPDDYAWRKGADGRPAFCMGPNFPTLDHVLALASGGTHSRDNARTAHMRCNARKGDRPRPTSGAA